MGRHCSATIRIRRQITQIVALQAITDQGMPITHTSVRRILKQESARIAAE